MVYRFLYSSFSDFTVPIIQFTVSVWRFYDSNFMILKILVFMVWQFWFFGFTVLVWRFFYSGFSDFTVPIIWFRNPVLRFRFFVFMVSIWWFFYFSFSDFTVLIIRFYDIFIVLISWFYNFNFHSLAVLVFQFHGFALKVSLFQFFRSHGSDIWFHGSSWAVLRF